MVGVVATKMLTRVFSRILGRFNLQPAMVSTVSNVFYVILLMITVATALHYAGIQAIVIRRTLLAISVVVVGLIVIFRPLFPTLPFKVGNTIMTGDLLGKVEATTFLNTRIKTFDGKTVFVPNSKILNDYLINYHFTPNRQIRLVVGITYSSDLLKAKNILADMIAKEPRVLDNPAARVFVLNLAENCVELAVRPWVKNVDYWRTRCDLLEKIKLCFDQEGITIAFPQRDVHLYHKPVEAESPVTENGQLGNMI
jgi:small conductance mechanosensitive channel